MEVITLKKEKSQTINVSLNSQDCTIRLYQMPSGMYLDLMKDGSAVVLGAPCLPFTKIVRYGYLNFSGDLFFVDYNGDLAQDEITKSSIETNLPNYTQLGTRYELYYLSPTD